jgi:capsular exopolysaccharide synthesis family protein
VATSVLKRSHYELTEAFAGLRSVLDSPSYKAHSKVILIASAMPEEGKTTTCCNLAVSCAQSGQKVLLIDFDLRRPRIASSFPMPAGSPGLLDHLANGKADPGNIPYASECPNLSIIGTRLIDNAYPSDLLSNPRVAELIAWARTAFDRIILDAPPLGIVSDALGLGSLADCVLVMARSDISRKKAVRLTADRFRDVGVTAIAAVMTDVNPARSLYHAYGPYNRYKKQYQAYHTAGEAARPDSLEKGQTQPGE